MSLKNASVDCPYCWETIEVTVDPSTEGQSYVEDCSVCCHPIVLTVHCVDGEEPEISASKENE